MHSPGGGPLARSFGLPQGTYFGVTQAYRVVRCFGRNCPFEAKRRWMIPTQRLGRYDTVTTWFVYSVRTSLALANPRFSLLSQS